MHYWKKVTNSNFLIRLKNWEYWPFGIVQFPAIVYWLWLSVRSRSLVFFSASNPGITMGGMFGESKYDILKNIPDEYKARTLLMDRSLNDDEVCRRILNAGMNFPLIFKPDLGERGYMVRRLNSPGQIKEYLAGVKSNFLVQELISSPLEFGVFYRRFPWQERGEVISLVAKKMLSVTGNGKLNLKELIFRTARAKLQWKKLRVAYSDRLKSVIPAGEQMELVSIGNHCLGVSFLNANHLINDALSISFDAIGRQIPGFHFGRFDLRCDSLQDLYQGKVKIVELNGCGAEPGHIYDPAFSLWEAMAVLVRHWHNIFEIAEANRKLGVNYVSHREAFSYYRKFRSAVK